MNKASPPSQLQRPHAALIQSQRPTHRTRREILNIILRRLFELAIVLPKPAFQFRRPVSKGTAYLFKPASDLLEAVTYLLRSQRIFRRSQCISRRSQCSSLRSQWTSLNPVTRSPRQCFVFARLSKMCSAVGGAFFRGWLRDERWRAGNSVYRVRVFCGRRAEFHDACYGLRTAASAVASVRCSAVALGRLASGMANLRSRRSQSAGKDTTITAYWIGP